MKPLLLILFALVSLKASASSLEMSSVYLCKFRSDMTGMMSVRMKDYFDSSQNMRVGKIDLIQSSYVIESTPVKVYQIPLLDNVTYVQLWNSAHIRVETTYTDNLKSEFEATYVKEMERQKLLCTLLQN